MDLPSCLQRTPKEIAIICVCVCVCVGLTCILAQHTKNIFDYENWIEDYPMMEAVLANDVIHFASA